MSAALMAPELVRLDVAPPGDKHAVIGMMADIVAATGRAERDGLEAGLLKREESFATGMPGGFAIPHCRTEAVHEAALALVRLSEPVDFGAADGPADLIIAITAPAGTDDQHLKLLAQLSRALIRPEFLAALRGASTPEEVSELVMDVVAPEESGNDAQAAGAAVGTGAASTAAPTSGSASASAAAASAAASSTAPSDEPSADAPVLLAITSCPTGIAHTYMAAESLENAAKDKGIELHVETQGSGGITPFTDEQIARASALIVAADVNISGRERFAGLPLVEHPVKRAISHGGEMIDEAVAAASDPSARRVQAGAATSEKAESGTSQSWPRRIQGAVMTGVSYMIPFVAAGGLLMALGFLLAGFDVAFVAQDVATGFSLSSLPGHQEYEGATGMAQTERAGLALYLGAVLFTLGNLGMGFLVAALSGYIAFGLAGRPGIAPGFIGGAVSVAVGAGFLGGLITGLLAGLIALWFTTLTPPRWLAGLMPVVIIPLVTTFVVGGLMLLFLGRPLAALMTALQDGLTGMSGSSAVLLGVIIGLMMCLDLGGPVNKAAYLFATAGLSQGTEAAFEIMAAVMAAGMVPPLAMALSTLVRRRLYSPVERENGTTAWLLGAAFISEGAIPFAAADPLRVIPSMMTGGAVTGALIMAFGVGSQAPHGGIFVAFAISPVWGFVLALLVGTVVAAALVTLLKEIGLRRQGAAA
ncbi:PTS system D-fructose-specific IIA component (F1P-forming) (Frc family) /PTS system D-fructose-specific IIB component (F1P-forming) (Frc family) /PTS system D-fructose-specific IIC component (F1P-forming) (Frc family) [Brachybacterium sp. AG952]|uniref:PTS fructose transporter subunit IIABC n=1 Tax=Brachybacterium sp. AG952 TaxID=2183989 RepID=UPI00105B7B86|nr:fructose-specific PTS transporter subunit EIIC [Brachybacterium sp. AG952]TDP80607.1 PTS system D-fructose-specific IIA component (F1P-forming) (Frc family) /PTS system D-fructose-specific IIB component (F1P-forming) (Frc family) /PTS system D-fructose-specific IIC component (F1P-forming) (Frc family) [Brachybacterium sp. AG952]